jgi:hypothetical protein
VNWIVVHSKPYAGRYPFDLSDDFTIKEWGWIKRLTSYMPLTVENGFAGGDPELYAALAVVMLVRAGRVEPRDVQDVYDRLSDGTLGTSITVEFDDQAEEEEDADPSTPSSSENGTSSGAASTTSSETWPSRRSGFGNQPSDTSPSDQPTWVN